MSKSFYKPRNALHQLIEHGFDFPGYTEQDIRNLIAAGDETSLLETDSLHLLKPQVGDWVTEQDTEGAAVVQTATRMECAYDDRYGDGIRIKEDTKLIIIQRHGIAFLRPDREEGKSEEAKAGRNITAPACTILTMNSPR